MTSFGIGITRMLCDAHFDWDSTAIHLGLTCEDLVFTLLSIDLGATPLPTKPEALAALPDLLPPRPQGHNVLIFAKPWYRLQEGGFRCVAKPPLCPPPHVKDSQHVGPIRPLLPSSSGSALPASAASALRSLPSLNSPSVTTSAKSGATSKSSNRPKDPVTVKAPPKAAPALSIAAPQKPAVVRGNSEIAKPRVRKPRVLINCHPDPPPKPPILPAKTCHCRSLHSTMHTETFPQGWEGFFGS